MPPFCLVPTPDVLLRAPWAGYHQQSGDKKARVFPTPQQCLQRMQFCVRTCFQQKWSRAFWKPWLKECVVRKNWAEFSFLQSFCKGIVKFV